jgi:hypothetical protein
MIDETRKGKTIKSAFDSITFEENVSIHVDRKVGSATISPSGRDVALASYATLRVSKNMANIHLAPTVSTSSTSILLITSLATFDTGFLG